MADETAESLRDMARHRGLKLVKSRRRKPGTGDFGKFGLTDDKGKPLLGIGEDGLTASAADIENYLRAGAVSTWQQSAKIVPDRPPSRSKQDRDDAPVAQNALPQRFNASTPRLSDRAVPTQRGKVEPQKVGQKAPKEPAPARPVPLEVEPVLALRAAKPADAVSLSKLLSGLSGVAVSEDDVVRNLAPLRKAGAGALVAELGQVIGCIAWSVMPTLQRGPIGRLTVLVVEPNHRRKGIGTQLLSAVELALANEGCALIEVLSDIDIKNSHNFFRTLKFEQTSYRFARKIAR